MLADFDFSIFINGLVIGLASAVSYIFSYFAITRAYRKVVAIVSFSIILVLSFVLIFIWDSNSSEEEEGTNILILVFFFVISFVITVEYTFFFVYLIELYPTQVRVIGISVVTVVGGITISVSDLIITLSKNGNFSIMIIFCSLAAVSILVSICLP